jgi:Arc/MetJ-type ribon-helix-helix transcriptional regulator
MARTRAIDNSVKYTVVLPEKDIEQLKELVGDKTIPSVNSAVREAVGEYIVRIKKEKYRQGLIAAVSDPDFIKRTDENMKYCRNIDKEAEEMIPEW